MLAYTLKRTFVVYALRLVSRYFPEKGHEGWDRNSQNQYGGYGFD